MDVSEILRELKTYTGTLPRRALSDAIEKRDVIVPKLVSIIDHVRENAASIVCREDYMAHTFALYLLGYFREQRAYGPIVEFFRLPGEIAMDLTGDVVTEDLCRILASVCQGDLAGIKSLVEDANANEYVRSAALEALFVLVSEGMLPRDEVVAYLGSLFRGRLDRRSSVVWAELVIVADKLYPEELLDDVREAYAEGLVDTAIVRLAFIEETVKKDKEDVLRKYTSWCRGLIKDPVDELGGWACFGSERDGPAGPKSKGGAVQGALPPSNDGTHTPTRSAPKVGRNASCPCGSGKKYKRCCGRP
jgi:hypothetical protein